MQGGNQDESAHCIAEIVTIAMLLPHSICYPSPMAKGAGDGEAHTWFCDAYASWHKGGVENAKGRLRRRLPRYLNIDALDDEDLQDIVFTANLTPRKCLGYKTPFQAMLADLGKDVQMRFD